MFKEKPVILSHINEKVVEYFNDSTTFYPNSFQVDFSFSDFDFEEFNILPYTYSFKEYNPSNSFFWMGNLSSFNKLENIKYLYLSNSPVYLIKYANQNLTSIHWGLSGFISTQFNYNIRLLKSLIQKFPNAKIFDVFPKGQTFMLNRAITELSLLDDKYSITSISDHYIIRNNSKHSTFKFFDKDFNITQLQRKFKYRIPCSHKTINL